MEIEITPAFPTIIGRFRVPDSGVMNRGLSELILDQESKFKSLGRSNIGGWHSQTDFIDRPESEIAALDTWVRWAVNRMIDATAGPGKFSGKLNVTAWATICRNGAYHAPHSHPDSAWSGVYYVDAGSFDSNHPLGGQLEFLDPRPAVDAVTAPGDPYGDPFRVQPESGLIVVFPSWLYHWVHPYSGDTPRIAISFNATKAGAKIVGESRTGSESCD